MGRNFKVHVWTFIRVLFSHPDVASVGLSPKKAKQQSCDTVVGSTPLSMNPFGMLLSVNEGLIEVVRRSGMVKSLELASSALLSQK